MTSSHPLQTSASSMAEHRCKAWCTASVLFNDWNNRLAVSISVKCASKPAEVCHTSLACT